MSVVTLLTDFGYADGYAAMMKGVLFTINPLLNIVDISHDIPPGDIASAAFMIKRSYRFFPEKTVHVIVVDPGVGTDRLIIAAELDRHIFLAPDNGVLSILFDSKRKSEKIYKVENRNYFLNEISRTFHGRDIFSPVAAHISKGVSLSDLGGAFSYEKMEKLYLPEPVLEAPGMIAGEVVAIDRFGNMITNISVEMIEHSVGRCRPEKTSVRFKAHMFEKISGCYGDAPKMEPLVLFGSNGCLEVAVREGSAKAFFRGVKGDRVELLIPQK